MTSEAETTPNPTRTKRVLAIGEMLIDLIVDDGAADLRTTNRLAVRPGGALANGAVALARLGVPSGFCGVVGADPFGDRLRQVLRDNGVDDAALRSTPDAGTTLAFAWKDTRGDGSFTFLRLADGLLSVDDVERAGIPDCAAILVGSVVLPAEGARAAIYRAVEIAASANVPVVFDVNFRPALWDDPAEALTICQPILDRATALKLSLDDAQALFGTGGDPVDALREAAALPPTITVLTDGARGCWSFATEGDSGERGENGDIIHLPVFPVEAVEPTGAGDAFTAGLITRLIANGWSQPTEADLRFAAAAGALATTRPGAMDGLPTRQELDTFLAAHPAQAHID
ncbi:MAG TPA: carbohydrate kinase [Thermomicrobiales bacterium]|nr:carbohydrate kinase [Thermomicrobiales bacterium]